MSIEEMRHEQQLVDRKIKEIMNDLGIRRFRGEEINEEYERDCEIRIQKLKQDFNIWGSEDDYIPLAITTDLPIEEPNNSLKIGDEHLDTIPATESDEVIKSSVENLVPIPSEFEGIFADTSDVPNCDDNREFTDELAHIAPIPSGIVEANFDLNDDTSGDNDDCENIEYVDATPPNSELVSLEEGEDIEPDQGGITSVVISNNDLLLESPEFESFHFDIYDEPDQEGLISIDNSNDPLLELPEFESFHFDPLLPRPPPEPPDVCLDMLYNDESFEPGEGENIVVSNVEEDDSFTFTIRTFLPFLTYPEVSPLSGFTESEDLIFDPGIITFHFFKPLAFLWKFLSSFALLKDD
ncbi:hypothetical protein Tco_0537719 [Tanacetum coccineum]